MNKLMLNLAVIFAFALCGLCLVQWNREKNLTLEKARLTSQIYTNKVTIQNLQESFKHSQEDIERISKIRTGLEDAIKTNLVELKNLTGELDKVIAEKDRQAQQLQQFRDALTQANESIKKQNDDIVRQNEMIKTIAAQRDERIEEYKKLVEKHNTTVAEYNKLVEEVNKANAAVQQQQQQQGGGQKK